MVIAPDNFKDSLSAIKVASNIELGIREVSPEVRIEKIPLSDGGDGLVESLVWSTNGKMIEKKVTGPLGTTVDAFYGILGDENTAVIEMAAASGLQLVSKEKRDASITTTYGTGELIIDALDNGCNKLILGVGGSATNDGGAGMAMALGAIFYDKKGKAIEIKGGKDLADLDSIDTAGVDDRMKKVEVLAACDVNNPLTGSNGATYIYGPQKGADKKTLDILEENLKNYVKVIKKSLEKEVDFPGAGAGGGFGAGIYAFLDGKLMSGIDLVLDAVEFEKKIDDADLIITGEGKLDDQSIFGKVPVGVSKRAKKYNIPVIALAGETNISGDQINKEGIDAYFSIINSPMTLDEALRQTPLLIEETISQIIRLYNICNT
ncbi:glycerate kinase [Natranaerofaba carboxydovora]|uniref:glycerate kinase family protein n=1 Tax=Natranaerofaba carboxydovora TaxID=2742683 RepID=UPI001F145AB9|nr:glycerate kinase [Natranaerofaba carboxydovora]